MRARVTLRGVSVAAGVLALLLLAGHAYTALFPYLLPLTLPDEGTAIIGGADGPTGILVRAQPGGLSLLLAALLGIAAVAGLALTRRRG